MSMNYNPQNHSNFLLLQVSFPAVANWLKLRSYICNVWCSTVAHIVTVQKNIGLLFGEICQLESAGEDNTQYVLLLYYTYLSILLCWLQQHNGVYFSVEKLSLFPLLSTFPSFVSCLYVVIASVINSAAFDFLRGSLQPFSVRINGQ